MKISKPIPLLVCFFFGLLSHCATTVTIKTQPPGVDAYYRGRQLGQTPVTERITDFVSEDHVIEFRKNGRFIKKATLAKEYKLWALIGGVLLLYVPALWGYGPEAEQYFNLESDLATAAPVPVSSFTDTVVLKNGTRYANVKAVILEEKIVVTTNDAKTYVFTKSEVDSIRK